VTEYLGDYQKILDKVHQLMKQLRHVKNRAKLRKLECPFQPVLCNDTIWSSTFDMIHCYLRIRSYIEQIDDDVLLDYLPSLSQYKSLEQLMIQLKEFESVTKALQCDELDIAEARALFDGIIEKYPSTKKYLSSDSKIIHSPNFENGIVKILNSEIKGLTSVEAKSVRIFLKATGQEEPEQKEQLSFAKEILEKKEEEGN